MPPLDAPRGNAGSFTLVGEEEMQEVDTAEVSDVLVGERNFPVFVAEAHRN